MLALITGYPTHFGQLECMKLTASPHFPEKRIGYLGMMLLLSEEADVLMLATNALKNDLNSENKFIAGLALCAIGNLATADMSRDLAPEVDKHLKSPLAYLRKKASLAMARCLSKCPDMVEDFVERVVTLLKDKSHGVLITVVQLMTQVLLIDFQNAEAEGDDPWRTPCRLAFLRLVPTLVKMLRNLLSSGYSPDHDVGGISDPFLQVQLLTLLRLLGMNNPQACEEMNDVLAQVATNTETAKNAGNAILYECVQTIMGIESEDGLRVLAVNILGRFLLNRDNNIRYVALNTLSRCMVEQKDSNSTNTAMSALQRHRQTVVECLKDPDVSIRQRALELVYHLVNESTVETLTAELLNYLVLCPREHRRDIATRILKVVDKYSPSDQWRIDTLITTLTIAGREASREVESATVLYISRASQDLQTFATHKLAKAIRDDDGSQQCLLSVGIWCMGEYGDLLLRSYTYTPSGSDVMPITMNAMDGMTVVTTIEDVTRRHSCPEYVLQRALTAFCKLSQRLSDPAASSKLEKLLNKYKISHSLELQLRSCEYTALINACKGIAAVPKSNPDDLFQMSNGDGQHVSEGVQNAAKEALKRMPMVDTRLLQKRLSTGESFGETSSTRTSSIGGASAPTNGGLGADLLDLADIFGGTPAPAANGTSTMAASNNTSGSKPETAKSDLDLLSDIFATQASTASAPAPAVYDPFGGGLAPTTPAVTSAPPVPAAINPLDLFAAPPAPVQAMPASSMGMTNPLDLFGAPPVNNMMQPAVLSQPMSTAADLFGAPSSPAVPAAAAPSTGEVVPGLSHGGLSVEFECSKPDTWNSQKSVLIARFKNSTDAPIYGMTLQVAVPKCVTMDMEPPSSTTIPNGMQAKPVTQKINITNSMLGTKTLMLKLKISFTLKGQKMEHMATCSGFPAGKY
jgi:AP-1 complex subunit gamma-1